MQFNIIYSDLRKLESISFSSRTKKRTLWIAQFEGPQEPSNLCEMRATSVNFMHYVFHADDTVFTQVLLDYRIISERLALSIYFTKSALVYQHPDGLQIRIPK